MVCRVLHSCWKALKFAVYGLAQLWTKLELESRIRELKLLSLEEAIRKMTSLPADFLKLTDRGQIRRGFAADVVIFDPKTIRDTSTWTKPNSMAVGVRDVMVNGKFVLRNGKLTETASGRFVKRN